MSMSLHSAAIESTMTPPSRDEAEQTFRHRTLCASNSPPPSDILIDGLIAYMFGPGVAEVYFEYLLKENIRRPLLYWDAPNWPGACFMSQARGVANAVAGGTSASHAWGPTARLLDYDARNLEGTVVPQALWSPQSQSALNKYVLDATLQFQIGRASCRERV